MKKDYINKSDEVQWITVKGTHICIFPGQSASDAINNMIEFFNEDKKHKISSRRLSRKLQYNLETEEEFTEQPVDLSPQDRTKPTKEHLSRLRAMWSDYHLGTCKPIELNGKKYFNIDRHIYITKGEYPDFYIDEVIPFDTHEDVVEFLEEIENGK